MQRIFASLLLLLFVLNANCSQSPVRQTTNGPVEGIEQTSSLGQKYYAFRGVPFAEPPITGKDPYTGEEVDRRFKAPVPLKRTWSDNLKVHNFSYTCIPSIYNDNDTVTTFAEQKTSENCLFLNIYVPAGGNANKTVLVWIYGGGFNSGDATDSLYGPDFLLIEDNIVVSIQYRVGIFGFLNLGLDEYSGNMGLKDQQLAIKWIFENIENFSGNKNEILLFGESAGGASVNFHLLNKESRKYFNRAFAISSSALSYYALNKTNNMQQMQSFLQINDTKELVEYLREADSDFLSTQYPFEFLETLTLVWVPTIENPSSVEPFLTETPEEIYDSDEAPIADTMFSFNSKEILTFRQNSIGKTDPLIAENCDELGVDLPFEGFNKITYPNEYKKSLEILMKAYYSDTSNSSAVESANIHLMSDLMLDYSILKALILQSNANNKGVDKTKSKNTFFFRFSMDIGVNLMRIQNHLKYEGAAHADDLCYYFHCHQLDHDNVYDEHLERKDVVFDAIIRMVKIITNFARTGNPSIENDIPFKSCKSSTEIYCQEISNDPKSSVTNNIKEQLNYNAWREIEDIYKGLQIVS